MSEQLILPTAADTAAAGKRMAARLEDGAVIALVGDLGAGKTHFVQGLAAGLDYQGAVTSPTFVLVNEYDGGRLPIYHFDFYRLEQDRDLLQLGWDEFLSRPGIVIAEWADHFPHLFPPETEWWFLSHDEETGGRILRRGDAGGLAT